MNNPQAHKRSHIVPKWLEYPTATKTGELYIPRKTPFELNAATKAGIEKDLKEFTDDPTSSLASRLMGAGIVVGDTQLATNMAHFISKQRGLDPLSMKLADKVLSHGRDDAQPTKADVRIATLKKWLSGYPKSPISWIELSRAYTIKGQDEQAKRAAIIALQLAPADRYVVRCAVRLFLHTSDFDQAWYYIKKASSHHFDPWIKATEVNVALISEKKLPDIKKYLQINYSDETLFQYSELLESVGYLELNAGNERKAKKQLRLAWQRPSENVITHAEWLLRNRLPGMRESANLDFNRSLEAMTWINYIALNVEKALESAREWELEEPYSKYPFIVGSIIASNAGYPDKGAEIALRGIQVDPHDRTSFNNLCYALLRAGRIEEAKKYIDKLKVMKGNESDLYCQATLGLFDFKMKRYDVGRQAYLEVINQFGQKKKYDLQSEALLNLVLAELDAGTNIDKATTTKALASTEFIKSPTITLLRRQVQNKLGRARVE